MALCGCSGAANRDMSGRQNNIVLAGTKKIMRGIMGVRTFDAIPNLRVRESLHGLAPSKRGSVVVSGVRLSQPPPECAHVLVGGNIVLLNRRTNLAVDGGVY